MLTQTFIGTHISFQYGNDWAHKLFLLTYSPDDDFSQSMFTDKKLKRTDYIIEHRNDQNYCIKNRS